MWKLNYVSLALKMTLLLILWSNMLPRRRYSLFQLFDWYAKCIKIVHCSYQRQINNRIIDEILLVDLPSSKHNSIKIIRGVMNRSLYWGFLQFFTNLSRCLRNFHLEFYYNLYLLYQTTYVCDAWPLIAQLSHKISNPRVDINF